MHYMCIIGGVIHKYTYDAHMKKQQKKSYAIKHSSSFFIQFSQKQNNLLLLIPLQDYRH